MNRALASSLCVFFAFASPLVAQGTSKPASESVAPDSETSREDARARAAWARLSASERKDLVEYLELELERSGTFQSTLIAFLRRRADPDPARAPLARAPVAYDPAVTTPQNVIPRHALADDAPAVRRAKEVLFAKRVQRAWQAAWTYDWGQGLIVRTGAERDPERIFENALRGAAPAQDLAEALVERALDDGKQRAAAAAFAHAYTDRAGGVYPGITLYDAYASGTGIEMPDVDVLGIVHDVLGDRTTWRAPVPATQHAALYKTVGGLFRDLSRHRGLRVAIARTFVCGAAELDDGYGGMLDNFHALWEDVASTPAKLASRLPEPGAWNEFLASWTQHCIEHGELYQAGIRRRETLEADARAVRQAVFAALETFGAFEPASPR